jgi:iron-sulfur cluster repair protein YtfE (RIC family)
MTFNQLEQLVPDTQQLDLSLTINDIVARYPETIAIFNRFGMDTCCGGAVTVEEAARRDGIDAAEVIAALRQQIEGA